jgi:hypothetical protein
MEDVKGTPSPSPAANPEHQDGNKALHCPETRHHAAVAVLVFYEGQVIHYHTRVA